jgi:hypothetical protein
VCENADENLRHNLLAYFEDRASKHAAARALRKCTTAKRAIQSLLRHIHSFSSKGQQEIVAWFLFYRTATFKSNQKTYELSDVTQSHLEYAFRYAENPDKANLRFLPKLCLVEVSVKNCSDYPAWLECASSPDHEESIKLAKILLKYEVDIDRQFISPHGAEMILLLTKPGFMQHIVDHDLSEATRLNVWNLLRSWGIRSTLQRLELMREDVMRAFKNHYVRDGEGKDALFALVPVIHAMYGDVKDIESSWPGDVPGYSSLDPNRFHISTLLEICAESHVDRFGVLLDTMFGEWNRKNLGRHPRGFQSPEEEKLEYDNSLRQSALHSMAKKRAEIKQREEINTEELKAMHQVKELQARLAKMNENIDEELCSVCMDEKVATCFEPCGHQICCEECANALKTCCICRATVVERKKAVFALPAEEEEEEQAETRECKPRMPDFHIPEYHTGAEYFEFLCTLISLAEQKERIKKHKKKIRALAETEASKNGKSANHKKYKKKNRRNRK